jgi:signal transduction histidine kinase
VRNESSTELYEQIAELKEAVAARDAFIAIAAHELRNPMTPIRGQAELLLRRVRRGACPPDQIEAGLERIEWLIDRYLKRATALLDVSRITSGKLSLTPEPVQLASVMRDAVVSLSPLAQHAGSAIELAVPDDLVGEWDRLGVEQIIDNLLANAIKYGAGNPIHLSVVTDGTSAIIGVRDHGIGIPDDERERIFARFERAIGSGKHATGFGIGLWLVRRLVEAMGGEVSVETPEGGGTLFTVTLPLRADRSR